MIKIIILVFYGVYTEVIILVRIYNLFAYYPHLINLSSKKQIHCKRLYSSEDI